MEEQERLRQSISSNHWSHDTQVRDAVDWLHLNRPAEHAEFLNVFNVWPMVQMEGSHFQWLAVPFTKDEGHMIEVDPEFGSWCCEWIEDNTPIFWEDGEPWVDTVAHAEHPADLPVATSQKMFAVQGGIGRLRPDGEWHSYKQIPTFYLHPNVQGILDERSARFIAEELLLNPLFPEERDRCELFLHVQEVTIP